MTHRHLSQDELLDRLLAEGRNARANYQGDCARCSAVEAELSAFLARCRASAAERAQRTGQLGSDRALAARVLARTTREDRGRQNHFGQLSAARATRLLYTSLAAHVLVLPLCAWLLLRPEPSERQQEPAEQSLLAVPDEPLEPAAELDPFALQRRLDRALLESTPVHAGATGTVERLLELRAGRDADLVRRGLPVIVTPLERALWLAILMDHLVLTGERLPALVAGLEGVGADPEEAPEVLWIEALVLERAWGLGLLGSPLEARLLAIEATLGERSLEADLHRPLASRVFAWDR